MPCLLEGSLWRPHANVNHARLVLLSIPLCSSPRSSLLHSAPCSFRTCPILPLSAEGDLGRLRVCKPQSEKSPHLIVSPRTFSAPRQLIPIGPGGSAVAFGAGSAGSGDSQSTRFVLLFLLNKLQREGRGLYKIKYPR